MRQALADLLRLQQATPAERSATLARFDDPGIEARIPDPQLRAAAILLGSLDPWSATLDAVLAPSPHRWNVGFAPLPAPVNALASIDAEGVRDVRLNELLIGDSLETTAAALLEGLLLAGERRTSDGALLAALMSTLAYADLVTIHPDAPETLTWGTVSRNLDLLALLNSAPWSAGGSSSASIGFLGAANGAADILPGLIPDATSFQAHVLGSARGAGADQLGSAAPSELLAGLAQVGGVSLPLTPNGPVIDDAAIRLLDGGVSAFLTPDEAVLLISALDLGIS
jgi:hypothetical protein